MQQVPEKAEYDVIVIGSGVGGLTAAALLSKAGHSVCVLEKEPHVGGYLAGFRRRDFLFDTAIHWLNQCAPDGLVGRLFDSLGSDHPTPVLQKRIRRYKGENYDYLLTNNPNEWRDELIREFPHEKKGLERFFKAAYKLGTSFKNFNSVFRSEETMAFPERMRNKFRLLEFVLPFLPYITYSGPKGLKRGLSRFFKEEKLHQIFAHEHELLGCLVPIGWAYYGDFQSPPKGGSQVIPQWLQYVVEYFGNEVCFRCPVQEVLIEEGRAVGVKCGSANREIILRSKYVVAACDVETLYEKMLPESAVASKMKQKLKNAELYCSSVTLSIALDCPAEELGFNEEAINIPGENPPIGNDPAKMELSILAPSQRDKTMAPEGKGTLTIYMPAQMDFRDNWLTEKDAGGNMVRGEAYRKLKQEIAETILSRVERLLGIDLKSHILFYEVATPVTHWRYTGNRNGTMMGAKPGRKNMQQKVAHYKTPVKNLILGGHWAELGGGVPIAVKAGSNAALLILQQENLAAFHGITRYMDNRMTLDELLKQPWFRTYDNSWIQPETPAVKAAKRGNPVKE